MTLPKLSADHLVLPAYDAAASRRFYGDLLGLPLIEALSGDDWGGYPWLMMIFGLGDDRQLVLCALHGAKPVATGLPREVPHYALSVKSAAELDIYRQRLRTAGIEHWEEDHDTQHSIYFVDPNGTILEITTPDSATAIPPNPEAERRIEHWLASHQ